MSIDWPKPFYRILLPNIPTVTLSQTRQLALHSSILGNTKTKNPLHAGIYSQSRKEPRFRGWWEKQHSRLCQCLVSVDIDAYRLGKNSAEGAQTSRTPVSSCQEYASRRPQEPWKYLDIFFAPPLVCIATRVHHPLWLRDKVSSGQRQTLKRLVLAFCFIVWLHFSHSERASCIPTPQILHH